MRTVKRINLRLFFRLFVLRIYDLVIWLPDGSFNRILRSLVAGYVFECGSNLTLGYRARINTRMKVGDGVTLGPDMRVMCYGDLVIEHDVLIGPEVVFIDTHHCCDSIDMPISKQGFEEPRPITVKEGAWLGVRAVVLPGVTIGKHAVVAACSVVTKDVEPYSIVAVIPARLIKKRV